MEITSHLLKLALDSCSGSEMAFRNLFSPLQDPVKPTERRFSDSSEWLLCASQEKASIQLLG